MGKVLSPYTILVGLGDIAGPFWPGKPREITLLFSNTVTADLGDPSEREIKTAKFSIQFACDRIEVEFEEDGLEILTIRVHSSQALIIDVEIQAERPIFEDLRKDFLKACSVEMEEE